MFPQLTTIYNSSGPHLNIIYFTLSISVWDATFAGLLPNRLRWAFYLKRLINVQLHCAFPILFKESFFPFWFSVSISIQLHYRHCKIIIMIARVSWINLLSLGLFQGFLISLTSTRTRQLTWLEKITISSPLCTTTGKLSQRMDWTPSCG